MARTKTKTVPQHIADPRKMTDRAKKNKAETQRMIGAGKGNNPNSRKGMANLWHGRPKGSKNKRTQNLHDAVIAAADNVGFVTYDEKGNPRALSEGETIGYLEGLAIFKPEIYAQFLLRVLPHRVQGESTVNLNFKTREQLVDEMNKRGIPIPVLDAETFKKMKDITPAKQERALDGEILPPMPPERPGKKRK